MLDIGLSLTSGSGVHGSGGVPPTPTLSLDAPIYSANSAKALYAFGFDRFVDGYFGNTVRLRRLSDNAVQDFGFAGDGKFDISAVNTWRSGADVDLVYFIDQMGSARQWVAEGAVSLVRSNSVLRFGTTMGTDAQLTRSVTDGCVGANLGRDVGNLRLASPMLDQVAGIEVDLLCAFNERKVRADAVASDALGGNANPENVFAWGTRSNNYVQHIIGSLSPTTVTSTLKYVTPAGSSALFNSDVVNGAKSGKRYAQRIFTYAVNGTAMILYDFGRKYQTAIFNATHAANMAAGAVSNGDIVVGGIFNSASAPTLGATKANIIVGGMIVWKPRTDKERYLARSKTNAIGQQHRIKSVSDILGYFDDIVLLKNINQSTGLVTGERGQLALQFNVGSFAEGTANFNFGHIALHCGLQGVYSPDDNNPANGFKATNTFFSGVTSGTVMALSLRDPTGNSGSYSNDLSAVVIQGTGNQNGSQNPDWSWGLGYDHNCITFTGKMAGSRDPDGVMGTRHYADDTQFGATVYDGANQSMGKYNRNTAHNVFTFGEAIGGVTYSRAVWGNQDTSQGQKLLDAPTGPAVLDNIGNGWKADCLALQIVTFEAPAGYSRTADYAIRKPLRLQSVNKSYVSIGDTPIAHMDGAVAVNNNAGVVDSDDNAMIMSHQFQRTFKGDRLALGFSSYVFTQAQVEEVQVNMYKLVA